MEKTTEQYIKERINEGWILIGEVEFNHSKYTECGDDRLPYYLYVRKSDALTNDHPDEGVYHYAIANNLITVHGFTPYIITGRISIATFLKMYISADRIHGRINGNVLGTNFEQCKIRLVGLTDWIEPDMDYYNGKISLKELENKHRSNKNEKFKEKYPDFIERPV